MKFMNMIDVAKACKWVDVKRALLFHYPEETKKDIQNLEQVFTRIQFMKRRKPKNADGQEVEVSLVSDWENVDGQLVRRHLENQYYSVGTTPNYGLDLRSWSECANLPVSVDTIERYTKEEVVAHFLWEITFYGTSEKDAQAVRRTLKSRLKGLKKFLDSQAAT